MKLDGKKIAILIAPRGTGEPEFAKPKAAVEEAGGTVTVVSLGTDDARSVNNDLDPGATFTVDKAVGDVSAAEFDALIIPGGRSAPTSCAAPRTWSPSFAISSRPASRWRRSATRRGCSSRPTRSRDGN